MVAVVPVPYVKFISARKVSAATVSEGGTKNEKFSEVALPETTESHREYTPSRLWRVMRQPEFSVSENSEGISPLSKSKYLCAAAACGNPQSASSSKVVVKCFNGCIIFHKATKKTTNYKICSWQVFYYSLFLYLTHLMLKPYVLLTLFAGSLAVL